MFKESKNLSSEEKIGITMLRVKKYFQEVPYNSPQAEALIDKTMLVKSFAEGNKEIREWVVKKIEKREAEDGSYWDASQKLSRLVIDTCSDNGRELQLDAVKTLSGELSSLVTELYSEHYEHSFSAAWIL